MSKKELLNTLIRYDSKRKVKKIHEELLKLGQEKRIKSSQKVFRKINK